MVRVAVDVVARRGWLAFLVVSGLLVIPATAHARPGGGHTYSHPSSSTSHGSSSTHYRRSRYRRHGSADTAEPQELSPAARARMAQEDLGEKAGAAAARADKQAGLPFDVTAHLDTSGFGDPNYKESFRNAYLYYSQPDHLTGDCLEIYFYGSQPPSTAESTARSRYGFEPQAARERFADPATTPMCPRSVATAEQAAAFRRGLRLGRFEDERSFIDRHSSELAFGGMAVVIFGGLIGVIYWDRRKKARGRVAVERAAVGARVMPARPAPAPVASAAPAPAPASDIQPISIADIRARDPSFSMILFEDLAVRLYAQAHGHAFPGGRLDDLAGYLGTKARQQLRAFHTADAAAPTVLVGSFRVVDAFRGKTSESIVADVESNITTASGGAEKTRFVRELVTFSRVNDLLTRPPSGARTFGCPACGAVFEARDQLLCEHCGETIHACEHDWALVYLKVRAEVATAPALTASHPEHGNRRPTVVDPRMEAAWQGLCADDPAQTKAALAARLALIYQGLNAGWSARDEQMLRPHLSDGLFDYFRYWLAAYRHHGLKNQLDDMRITGWELAKVTRDAFYDAVTVRLYATGLDYTVEAKSGKVVTGSRSVPRPYTEYWTLIRGRGVRGAPRAEPVCPQCGGPLAISMGGSCEHCQAHVTRGEFDWVLSRIEQDEAYRG